MLKLKETCTALKFNNLVHNETTIKTLMYGSPSQENATEQIKHLESCCITAPQFKAEYESDIQNLKNILEDPNYQSGLYPRGLEEIIQQIIEPMAFWHAISTLESAHFFSSDNYFCRLVDVSLTFMLSCEIAKLFNSKLPDFSLLNVWKVSREKVISREITTAEEVFYIDEQFEINGENRKPPIKRLLNFRNKQVAHNSASGDTEKNDFIFTTKFVLRVWAILDALYSPECFPRPIHLDEHLFEEFYKIMTSAELKKVKNKRLSFINELIKACRINLVSGDSDSKAPFAELKVSFNIV